MPEDDHLGDIRMLTEEEARAYFEEEVQKYLGISGDAFLAQYHAGVYAGHEDDTDGLRWVFALLPLAEPERHDVSVAG